MTDRFIFWGTGADFSLAVINRLRQLDCLPDWIAIPEYPPSKSRSDDTLAVFQPDNQNRLVAFGNELEIPILYAPRSATNELASMLAAIEFDFIVVACWPYRIPAQIVKFAKKAAMNIHPSLLPAYRGADPVKAQIENREKQLGVTLHLLSEEFDSGDIIASRQLPQPDKLERGEIERLAARLGAEMFIEACARFGGPGWNPQPQNSEVSMQSWSC